MAKADAQLAAIVERFDSARVRLHGLVGGLTAARAAARPAPDAWSAVECIAHLNLTSRAYVPLLRAALGPQGSRQDAPRRYRRDLVGWMIGVMSGPLPRIGGARFGRVQTTPAFVPGGDLPLASVVQEFDRLQDEQVALTRAADGLPLGRILIQSPFDARVRYNAYSCLVLLPAHQHRHLEQAERAAEGRR